MKVTSINGPIPGRAHVPSQNNLLFKNQQDIVDYMTHKEDISQDTITDHPIFGSNQPLCGREMKKETVVNFLRNSLRMRRLTQHVYIATGGEVKGDIKWSQTLTKKDIQKYDQLTLCKIIVDQLAEIENLAAISIGVDTGVQLGTANKPVNGQPSMTIWYRKG